MHKIGSVLQDLGKALMMPISVIAAAGIFLGLAAAMQNPNVVGEHFMALQSLQLFIGFIRKIAGALFANLPVLFALAAAIGFAKDEKPTAAFAALIGFISMHVGISYALFIKGLTAETTQAAYLIAQGMDRTHAMMFAAEFTQVLGIFSYNMSVLGGVFAGLMTAFLHNRCYRIVLPVAINFFGGRRFVPIITVLVLPVTGLLWAQVWPLVGSLITHIGELIGHSGAVGTFIYAFAERLLIPTGLHHILNETVRFTPIGGMVTVGNETYVGALTIFNAALAQPGLIADETVREATRFLAQGKIPVMMFGLPGAALAMYQLSRPENKARVKALLMAGVLASFTTGITEPLEFSFIFIAPVLFVLHAVLTGLSFMLMDLFEVMIGNVQGGVIDLAIFGILGGTKTHWWFVPMVGLCYFAIYYFSFRFFITRLNLATLGRESVKDNSTSQEQAETQTHEQALAIIEGLGSAENITDVDCCFTRLRVKVKDTNEISEALLMKTGASGVKLINKTDLQVIYGPQVESIANSVKAALK